MTQVGQINQAIRNAYEELENMPVSTGLLTRTEKKEDKPKVNDAVRLLKIVKDKINATKG